MSTLLLLLPPRVRLRAQNRSPATANGMGYGESGREYDYVLTSDGQHVTAEGRAAASLLPQAGTVIAIPDESDVSWRRIELPRAGRQMRSALAGLLEESLLDEPDSLHFAIEPDATGGDTAWVAVTARAWLADHLAHLDSAHVYIDRVVPLSWPDLPPRGHFYDTGIEASPIGLRWSHPDGVATVPLNGSLSRQLFPPSVVQSAQWTSAPSIAAEAEHWLGQPVTALTPAQRALIAIDSPWNLRQFDMAQRTRGIRAFRQLTRGLMRRNWRPVRWGAAGLVAVQLLGINAMAWQQHRQLEMRRAALDATLKDTYPQVRSILDAPVQMLRETDLLRASAGGVGDQDFETLLAAAATAWPAERGAVDGLSFEPGRLTLSANGWSEPQIQQFRSQLRSEGWQLETSEGRMTLSRAPRSSSASLSP